MTKRYLNQAAVPFSNTSFFHNIILVCCVVLAKTVEISLSFSALVFNITKLSYITRMKNYVIN